MTGRPEVENYWQLRVVTAGFSLSAVVCLKSKESSLPGIEEERREESAVK